MGVAINLLSVIQKSSLNLAQNVYKVMSGILGFGIYYSAGELFIILIFISFYEFLNLGMVAYISPYFDGGLSHDI